MTTFKKKLKGLLSAWLVVAILAISVVPGVPMTASALSYEFCGENATYTLSDGVLTISGTGAIDANAFRGRSDITSVVIGEGITTISNYAFYDCASLTTVTIPASVTAIGSNAFANCSSLTTVTYKGTAAPSAGSNAFSTTLLCVNVPVDYEGTTFAGIMAKKPIEITTQPQNKTAVSGETATFSVVATGTGLTYDWDYQFPDSSTWRSCSTGCVNTSSATMTVVTDYEDTFNTNGTKYRCVISDTNGNSLETNVVTLTVTAMQNPPATGEGYTINYTNETITLSSGYEAFTNSAATTPIASGAAITPGMKVYIRKAASGALPASATVENTVAARPAVPTGLTQNNETVKGKGDGSLIGLNNTMEYKLGSGAWTAATGNLTGLAAGTTVQVRYKATATAFASEIQSLAIGEGATLSVTFNLNGGDGTTPAPQTGLAYGGKASAPDTTGITKPGHKLLGWNEDSTATTADWDFATSRVTDNITLYAVWEEKAIVAITSTTAQNAGTYDGNAKAFNLTNELGLEASSFTVQYIYKGAVSTYADTPTYVTPQAAGYYDVVITRDEDDTYKSFSLTIENGLYIAPIVAEIAWSDLTGHVYDGYEKWVTAEISNKVESDDVYLVLTDGVKTLAGNYTATVTGIEGTAAGNYVLGTTGLSQEWSIAPRTVFIRWDYTEPFEYDGTEKTVNAWVDNSLGSGMLPVEPVVEGNAKTNAGDYNATVTGLTGEGAANYTLEGATGTSLAWTIAPRPVSVVWSNYSDLVYNAAPQTIVATVSNKAAADVVNLTLSGATQTNKGDYTAEVTGTDNTNYTIIGSSNLSQNWSISAKTLDSSNIQPISDRAYTNNPISPAVLIKDGNISLVAGVDYNITGFTNNINPGNAGVTVEYIGNYTGTGRASFKILRTTILGGITFVATFDSNGGSEVEDKKVQRLQKLEEPYAPEKEGYIFSGWYIDADLREKYSFEESVTDHLNLYAKWIPEEKEENTIYNDVSENDWFYEAVKWAKDNNYMNGVSGSSFAPNQAVTRAMFVTILYRIEGMPETAVTHSFEDVSPSSYYAKAVAWGVANGIVKGYSESEFGPDKVVNREEMATFVYRYAKLKGADLSAGENTNILSYTDFGSISEYAIPAIQYAVGNKIISGNTATTINPQNPATRAETATVFMRAMKVIK